MSIRGTRTFPQAGIRGAQGNDGPQGPSYSISSFIIPTTALANGSNNVTLSSGLPTDGTIKFWGNLNITASNATRITIIPVIGGSTLNEFKCTVYVIDPGGAINVALAGELAVSAGNSVVLTVAVSAGTGSLDNGTVLYSIEA